MHFAIQADDLDRARAFYQSVFDWRFEPWGPPDFFRIHTGDEEAPGIEGALERRQTPLTGEGFRSFVCTIAVPDLDDTLSRLREAGAEVLVEPVEIPTVGRMVQFRDPAGNVASAMQYEDGRR